MPDPIERMAQRATDDPFYVASAMAEYARSEGIPWRQVASLLGCSEEQLSQVALCRRPYGDAIWNDLVRIAGRFALDAEALATMVRRADALTSLRGGAGTTTMLQAARDREDGEEAGNGDEP
ncbi:MAG: hypothetical protein M3Z66_24055 [Chloroflexota bacterium]|nr:hypothetical protein [Chloroflexota bacterium]